MVDVTGAKGTVQSGELVNTIQRFPSNSDVVVKLPDGRIAQIGGMDVLYETNTRSTMLVLLTKNPKDKH